MANGDTITGEVKDLQAKRKILTYFVVLLAIAFSYKIGVISILLGLKGDKGEGTVYVSNRLQPIVFIGGYRYSGLNATKLVIETHPSVSCGPDQAFISLLMDTREQWKKYFHQKFSRNADLEDVDSAIAAGVLAYLNDFNGKVLVYQSNDIVHHTPYLIKLFPNAKFICVVRNGWAVSSIDTKKRGLSVENETAMYMALMDWNNWYERVFHVFEEIGHHTCHTVFYEHLVRDPAEFWEDIHSFLNLPENDFFHWTFLTYEGNVGIGVKGPNGGVTLPLEGDLEEYFHIPDKKADIIARISPEMVTLGYAAHFESDEGKF